MGEQLSFFFNWSADVWQGIADKHMPTKNRCIVYRSTEFNRWVVGREVFYYGHLGAPAGSYFVLFPFVFTSGKEAWDFVRNKEGLRDFVTPFSIVCDG